jgi:hypothetical protein
MACSCRVRKSGPKVWVASLFLVGPPGCASKATASDWTANGSKKADGKPGPPYGHAASAIATAPATKTARSRANRAQWPATARLSGLPGKNPSAPAQTPPKLPQKIQGSSMHPKLSPKWPLAPNFPKCFLGRSCALICETPCI